MQHDPQASSATTVVPRRTPEQVMRLERMGSAHQGRLSFMRTLLRRLQQDNWQFACSEWAVDERGVGHAVYQAQGPERTYSLIAFAHDLPDELRSDRVIAEAWDATFTLFDGLPTADDIARLAENVPKQEAGRITASELSLSRANRSVRLFAAVVDALAAGEQPDARALERIGYLMRTTAVYGSGKFGAADRDLIWQRPELAGPFQVEMLTVWLIRTFTVDLVEHLARVKGGEQAVTLDPVIRRSIGVGNSTGLGMAPFLMNHPVLLNNWMLAREEAIARVRSVATVSAETIELFRQFVARAWINADQWQSENPRQQIKITANKSDIRRLQAFMLMVKPEQSYPWDKLFRWAERNLTTEGQELVSMLMLEPYAELVDGLTDCMNADEQYLATIDGSWTMAQLRQWLEQHYQWALSEDYAAEAASARFWYTSEEKLEPRLGERYAEPGMELEQPLAIGRDVQRLYQACQQLPADSVLHEQLADEQSGLSALRHVLRRVQQIDKYPYMEIQDNLIAAEMMPVDLLRLKLSFFGATKFDPRSDRWLRITMFQHAPFPHELAELDADDWVYPPLPDALLQLAPPRPKKSPRKKARL